MDRSQDLSSALREMLAPGGVWELQPTVGSLLSSTLACLPKGNVSDEERRYPTTRAGLRAFMDGFFARHYFQVQDSLVDFFASPAFSAILRRGTMHIADVGCGPSVASLGILDMASAAMSLMNGGFPGKCPLTVHIALNDSSEVCLSEGRVLLDRYSRCGPNTVRVGRVLPFSTPFPESLLQLRRIERMTIPYDICCLGYVLIPLSEKMGVGGTAERFRQLAQTGNQAGGQLLLTQDKFREGLLRSVCWALGVSAEIVDLEQRVYDSQNQNDEQTYTYGRSCSPVTVLRGSGAALSVA